MRPEDIISDTQNEIMLNGVTVRKGTVGAFLANIDTLENSSSFGMWCHFQRFISGTHFEKVVRKIANPFKLKK